jgi:hypothetical protein
MFKSDIQKMPDYIKAISSSSNQENSVVSAFTSDAKKQPGTYFKYGKRGLEFSAMVFNVYE